MFENHRSKLFPLAANLLLLLLAGFAVWQVVGSRPGQVGPLTRQAALACVKTVSADITANTTWLAAESPVCLTRSVTVNPYAVLTIEPGVTVQAANGALLLVQGRLIAVGSPAQFITFTSEAGIGPGDWTGLSFDGNYGAGKGRLEYITLRYAGASYYGQNHGLRVERGAQVSVTNSQIMNNLGNAVQVDDSSRVTFAANSVQDNSAYPLLVPIGNVGLLSDNTFTGNGYNRVLISASSANELKEDATWRKDNGSGEYELAKPSSVGREAALTLEPGVMILARTGVLLEVFGALNATGTVEQPITFTSALDNGAGQWIGLVFDGYYGVGQATLNHVHARCAGATSYGENHAVRFERGATGTIINSQISNNLGYGLLVDDTSRVNFSDNIVRDNSTYPLMLPVGSLGQVSNNAFIGNTHNRVLISASSANTLTENVTWRKDNGSGVYELAKPITVDENSVLTLEPGVTVMGRAGSLLLVNGELIAAGTVNQPITFTSNLDSAGGQWIGLVFDGYYGAGKGWLDYVILRNAGQSYYGGQYNLSLQRQASVKVTNSQINHSAGMGVGLDAQSSIVFDGNAVANSASYGMSVYMDDLNSIQNNTFTGNQPNRILIQPSTLDAP